MATAAAALREDLASVPAEAFAAAVDRAIFGRWQALMAGIQAYRQHPYRRSLADPPAVWQDGSTRLLDYGGPAGAIPLLVVPSLINRSYILDLAPRRSFLRFLAGEGIRPLLVDWGAPGAAEQDFDLEDYVAGRLTAALDAALDRTGGPILLLGYCMGGTLAMALALRRQSDVSGLALLATPWDFHADNSEQARATAAIAAPLLPAFDGLGQMPVDMLQAMFTALDPFLTVRKFAGFASLDPTAGKAREFVALEDWVNDGVPITPAVARACLIGWYGENQPANGRWQIAGEPVLAGEFTRPALVVIPAQDRIVPPASAAALADALPGCRRMTVKAGHIGMVVGGGARRQVWRPVADWLRETAATGPGKP
ncbi:MAG: alpha/beta fold hydrolase [Alphaproteobacteria bacterium]|nr:alpha/beta fold hydrolase [Alphaproteobacteria bacterium]